MVGTSKRKPQPRTKLLWNANCGDEETKRVQFISKYFYSGLSVEIRIKIIVARTNGIDLIVVLTSEQSTDESKAHVYNV